MRSFRSTLAVAAVMLAASGCSSGGTPVEAGLQGVIGRMGQSPPATVQEYQSIRSELLASADQLRGEQEQRAGSSGARVKKVFTSVGTFLGLGGTIASFLIDNDDTKASVSQLSAAVAGISGLIGLIPTADTRAANGVARYLTLEVPRFEARWPATPTNPLSRADWSEFVVDASALSTMVGTLGR